MNGAARRERLEFLWTELVRRYRAVLQDELSLGMKKAQIEAEMRVVSIAIDACREDAP